MMAAIFVHLFDLHIHEEMVRTPRQASNGGDAQHQSEIKHEHHDWRLPCVDLPVRLLPIVAFRPTWHKQVLDEDSIWYDWFQRKNITADSNNEWVTYLLEEDRDVFLASFAFLGRLLVGVGGGIRVHGGVVVDSQTWKNELIKRLFRSCSLQVWRRPDCINGRISKNKNDQKRSLVRHVRILLWFMWRRTFIFCQMSFCSPLSFVRSPNNDSITFRLLFFLQQWHERGSDSEISGASAWLDIPNCSHEARRLYFTSPNSCFTTLVLAQNFFGFVMRIFKLGNSRSEYSIAEMDLT